MDSSEKRKYIQNHLSQVKEPILSDLYKKVASSIEDNLMEESEEDIKTGNVISHQSLKEEIGNWRPNK